MKAQTGKQHTNVVAVQPLAMFQKEDRMKQQGSTTGERMTRSKRSIAISVAFFLLAIASIPAYAWQADRVGLSNVWVITCKDGSTRTGEYGPNGPDFWEGMSFCATHGGIAAPPKPGTRSLYGISIPVDVSLLSPVTVEDLFSQGVISSQDGFRLTNTFDQEVWAITFLEFRHVPIGGNTFKGVFVIGVSTLIPTPACDRTNLVFNGSFEAGDFTGWTIGGGSGDKTRLVSGPFYAYPGAEDGQFYAALGPVGSDGTISQTFATTAGANYIFSFWMASAGDDPSDFSAKWNGTQVFSQTDPILEALDAVHLFVDRNRQRHHQL